MLKEQSEEKKTDTFTSFKIVDIEKLENEFNFIQEKLNFFKKMKKGDKIMKTTDASNNSVYYIIEDNDWQRTKRWWYAEDRNKTIAYLDIEFKYFAKYLDEVLFNMKEFNLLKYYTLALDISKYINDILPGLYSLKETYTEFDTMENKVDSIITTLIDYKDQVELYKNANKNRRQFMNNHIIKRERIHSN